MSLFNRGASVSIFLGAVIGLLPGSASADSVEDFYKGNTITIVVGSAAGGGYDLYSRLLARHIGRHIPGQPTVVVRNRPGAGGLVANNAMYNIEKRDGTTLGFLNQTMAIAQKLGYNGVKYDAAQFNWIGRITLGVEVVAVSAKAGVKTIDDVKKKEVVTGANSATGTSSIYPRLLNNLAGTRFKVVYGYPGMNDTWLAMERGEVSGGSFSLPQLQSAKADWLRDGRLIVLAQVAFERQPSLPNVPLLMELGSTEIGRQVLRLYSTAAEIGRTLNAPPDVPKDRVAALRTAFDETMKDPEFIAHTKKINADIGPLSGVKLQEIITSSVAASDEVANAAKAAVLE
jgi:tripartite-type tricarboxylate transporter receptor subunit TctC